MHIHFLKQILRYLKDSHEPVRNYAENNSVDIFRKGGIAHFSGRKQKRADTGVKSEQRSPNQWKEEIR